MTETKKYKWCPTTEVGNEVRCVEEKCAWWKDNQCVVVSFTDDFKELLFLAQQIRHMLS